MKNRISGFSFGGVSGNRTRACQFCRLKRYHFAITPYFDTSTYESFDSSESTLTGSVHLLDFSEEISKGLAVQLPQSGFPIAAPHPHSHFATTKRYHFAITPYYDACAGYRAVVRLYQLFESVSSSSVIRCLFCSPKSGANSTWGRRWTRECFLR